MKVDRCIELTRLLGFQREKLREAIEVDKWFLSEQAKRDVGFEVAEKDFIRNYLREWAQNFRIDYCTRICDHSKDCSIYQKSLNEPKENPAVSN